MLLSLFVSLSLWTQDLEALCSPPEGTSIVGVARSMNSDDFLYCEFHAMDAESHEVSVNYVDSSGHIFAKKNVTYHSGFTKPDIHQTDLRSGEVRRAVQQGDAILAVFKKNNEKDKKQKRIDASKVDVIDAGFDHFIRQHWETIDAGHKKNLSFLSIPHVKAIDLRAYKKLPEDCNITQADKSCIWVDVDNSIFRMFVGRLKLTYDDKRRLERFSGVVNINGDNKKSVKATIRYFYHPNYTMQWDVASKLTLK